MALYKGIELTENLYGLIRHMSDVEEYRENLQALQTVWDNLTLLGQLSGAATDMIETRQAFNRLTESLLNNLGQEILKKTVLGIKSKAQVTVDIMIRNLFERTADIGFLATDEDLREYLYRYSEQRRNLKSENSAQVAELIPEPDALANRLRERFSEYVQKYSVYFDIIVLDLDGNVVIQLDPTSPVKHSRDALLQESLTTTDAYVETFRYSDLLPNEPVSLIYSYRVTTRDGRSLGVLCLCFRFQNETEGIFANLADPDGWSVIMLLDQSGRVIASSEEHHIPVGAKMEPVLDRDWRVVRFAGSEYLAVTRPTTGYQGYVGPGWLGHVMVPVQHAFEKTRSTPLSMVSPEALSVAMANPSLFTEALRNIPLQAERIQRELNRSVWNGNVRQSSDGKALNPAFSKILLWEISSTGYKTQKLFEHSIDNLHQTVVSAILQDSQFLAALAIDIMDRNLYERANDCRWWALNSEFRRRLGNHELSRADTDVVADILVYINSLYTVYDNLVLFDHQGIVVAMSNPIGQEFIGQSVPEEWISQTLSLRNSQDYVVSAFASTPLYRERHTYIYSAAIRSPDASRVVGGIGIVFDARPQFEAMLQDALPRSGGDSILPGSFGVFVDQERKIIAATRDELALGTLLDIEESFLTLKNGKGFSGITEYQGNYYAVGACMSKGYREYKGPLDAYRNNVVALIFAPLGNAAHAILHKPETQHGKAIFPLAPGGDAKTVEIATFYVAGNWLGISAAQVVEAIGAVNITSILGAAPHVSGMVVFRGNPILVVNLAGLLNCPPQKLSASEGHIVVIHHRHESDGYIGLWVDALGEIPEIPLQQIEKMHTHLVGENGLTEGLIRAEEEGHATRLLTLLSLERIRHRIAGEPT